jgi:hypothetical protein
MTAKIVKRLEHESVMVSFVYPLAWHCTFSIIYSLLCDEGFDKRYGMGRKDGMFGRLFIRRMDDGNFFVGHWNGRLGRIILNLTFFV